MIDIRYHNLITKISNKNKNSMILKDVLNKLNLTKQEYTNIQIGILERDIYFL